MSYVAYIESKEEKKKEEKSFLTDSVMSKL